MAKFKVKCFVKQSDKHDPVRKLATIMEAADHRQTARRRIEAAENRGGELRRGIQEDGLWH